MIGIPALVIPSPGRVSKNKRRRKLLNRSNIDVAFRDKNEVMIDRINPSPETILKRSQTSKVLSFCSITLFPIKKFPIAPNAIREQKSIGFKYRVPIKTAINAGAYIATLNKLSKLSRAPIYPNLYYLDCCDIEKNLYDMVWGVCL